MSGQHSDHLHSQRHFIILPEDFRQWFTVNHFIPGAFNSLGDVPSEKVVCTLQLNETMIDHANYVFAYCLMLYVEVPEFSRLDLAHSFSPIVTIAYYEGDSSDSDAPSWTCIPPQKIFEFHQPRHSIAELFFQLASSEHNYTEYGLLKSNMLNWASAVCSNRSDNTDLGTSRRGVKLFHNCSAEGIIDISSELDHV